jgi:hypothetical protein
MAIIDINIPIEDAVTDGSLNPVTSNAVFDAINGLVPNTRNLTINGVTYDLSADRSWVIAATASTLQHAVKAGEAMTKGQAVYVSSADGTNMIVSKASNATEATSSKTMGLISQTLATNGQGFVITEGLLAGLNTSTATAGDPVWLGTGGNLIYGLINKPAAPAHLVFIGIVTRANVSNGEIFVRVQNGFELQELHNVAIASPTNGQTLTYESATSLWKNTTPATGITVGTTPITSGTVGRILFEGAGNVVQQSSLLFWDDANKRLGVGAPPSSAVRLDVRAQGALSTDIALRVRNSADTANLFELRGNTTFDFPTYLGGYVGGLGSEVRMGNAGTFYTQANQFVVTGSSVVTATNGAFIQDSVGQNVLFNSRFIGTSQISLNMGRANIHLGGLTGDTHTGHNILGIANGTAPSASYTDRFMLYSADITAGNAAPHFRTENGTIVKLYQNAAVTSAQGIADALTNLGVLASSTIAASIPTHDGPTYDTNAIQTLTAAEYAAIGTPNASTLYFIV